MPLLLSCVFVRDTLEQYRPGCTANGLVKRNRACLQTPESCYFSKDLEHLIRLIHYGFAITAQSLNNSQSAPFRRFTFFEEKVHFPRNYRLGLQKYRMPETAEKVPISGNRENASALGLAVDPCKNLVLRHQFPFADTERRKVRSVHQLAARHSAHQGRPHMPSVSYPSPLCS